MLGTQRGDFVQLLSRHIRAHGHIQPAHIHRRAAGKDHIGGLRVRIDVELGSGGNVSADGSAAHDDDPFEQPWQFLVFRNRKRQVGQGPDRNHRQLPGCFFRKFIDRVPGGHLLRRALRQRQFDVV
ncbi:hypothetical protein SDC9_205314 [bioreactor metagenome]|uniref:Uncharacterized protein n=1 Tax=bioreactor metagenome TaxID=1076179 RepID=A0A645J3B5_9ZZZZ